MIEQIVKCDICKSVIKEITEYSYAVKIYDGTASPFVYNDVCGDCRIKILSYTETLARKAVQK